MRGLMRASTSINFLRNSRALRYAVQNEQSRLFLWPKQTSAVRGISTTNFMFTSDNQDDLTNSRRQRLPALMDFHEIVWPSIFKSIKNWILINFIIRPYFDKDFTIQEFSKGSKHALSVSVQVFRLFNGANFLNFWLLNFFLDNFDCNLFWNWNRQSQGNGVRWRLRRD